MHIEEWTFKDMVLINIEARLKASKERLETESSASVLYEFQGRVAGLKEGRDKIVEEFGPLEGTMARENAPDVTHLSRSQLESFSADIVRNQESWQKITDFVKEWEAQAKDDLWGATSIVSREVKRAHGQRDGMKTFEELMDTVGETLADAKAAPTLFDQVEEDDPEEEFPEEDFDDMEGEQESQEEDVIPFPENPVGESNEDMGIDPEEYEEEFQEEEYPTYGD